MVTPTALVITLEVVGVTAVVLVAIWRRGGAARATLDVPERIHDALTAGGLPAAAARALATEAAVFYYALAPWRSRPFVPPGASAFSYHRRNAYAATLYAIVGMAIVEMAAVDLLVRSRHVTAANALLVVDALAAIWVLGFARSVQLRPILLTGDSLLVRNGLAARVEIPRTHATVEFGRVRAPARGTPGYFRAALGQPNALVTVSTPVTIRPAYGRLRTAGLVGLVLDDPKAFERAWRSEGAVGRPEHSPAR